MKTLSISDLDQVSGGVNWPNIYNGFTTVINTAGTILSGWQIWQAATSGSSSGGGDIGYTDTGTSCAP